jgi:hypothetical protein
MPIYDANFTVGSSGIQDVPVSGGGAAGLWASQPAGHWSVSGTTLVGVPAGSSPGFLIRSPSGRLSFSGRILCRIA